MRFPSMVRRLRNTQAGMRSTRSTPYTPYMPEPPVDPPPVDPPPVDPPMPDPPAEQDPPAAPGAVPIPPTSPSTPVARITSDHQTVAVGDTVSFDGSGSTGRGLKYSWAFGANASPATDTVVKPSCTYGMPGNKTVTLIVTDDRGVESDVATLNIRVIEVTLAANPQTVLVGTAVTFTGTVSNAPDGANLTYLWDFGDAEAISLDDSGVMAACIYLTHGERTVTLTVSYTGTDNEKVEASDTLTVTVIHIKSREVEDGTENVKFKVLGAPSGAEFFWYSRYPEGAGNTPEVVFLRPNPREPNAIIIEKAKWFAWPNRACRTDEGEPAGRRSQYTIICNITFPDGRFFAAMADLTVVFSWEHGGFIGIGYSGDPTMKENSATRLWEVTGRGNMERVIIPFTLPESSQFYPKIQAHEEVHVNQINTGIASSYYTVERLWANHLSGLTRESKVDLEIAVEEAIDAFVDAEHERIKPLVPQLERDAYEVSDTIAPQYLFQRCDRFSNDDVDDC